MQIFATYQLERKEQANKSQLINYTEILACALQLLFSLTEKKNIFLYLRE